MKKVHKFVNRFVLTTSMSRGIMKKILSAHFLFPALENSIHNLSRPSAATFFSEVMNTRCAPEKKDPST